MLGFLVLLMPLAFAGTGSTRTHYRRQTKSYESIGNPILADGSVYSADPAPLVVNNTVYIMSGRDSARQTQNSFIMNEWLVLEASNPRPDGSNWTIHNNIAQPQSIFSWASPGTAYASQVIKGLDGRFYLYAPVTQRGPGASDPFGIGVAVSNSPLGPFTDAHPSGPIISQKIPVPGNDIQNIDPTVIVDTDNRVFIYWGTFGQLRGCELERDMVTLRGSVVSISSLTGFFEAPWVMKRGSTYYMLYAGNNAGANSPCTPTSYHACIAYGTASSPLGPWTYRGVVLEIVSSTTSHPGVFQLYDQWYIVYHTRDAAGGTHFRRSLALDHLEWDDAATPPSIRKVVQTRSARMPKTPSRNIAPRARPTSANGTPIQYWIAALNDERIEASPLPPDYWCSWAGERSPQTNTLTYSWNVSVELNGVAMAFFADQPAGSNVGVPPPASWRVEYLDTENHWQPVLLTGSTGYPTTISDTPAEVQFHSITTMSVRAILTASGRNGQYGAVGVKEWMMLAPTAS
jgi:hypothetical protein